MAMVVPGRPPAALVAALLAAIAALGAAAVPAARAEAPIRIYGAAGSFGALGPVAPGSTVPVTPVTVPGWGFLPGQSAYFPAVADDGTVLIANEPQTDNQLLPTARQMVISTFQPRTQRFRNVLIPTSTGRTTLGGPWATASSLVGGADVADLEAVEVGGQQRIAFSSAMPYWGWSAADGVFPTLGYLSRRGGSWVPDPRRSVTAAQLAEPSTAASACAVTVAGSAGAPALGDCRLPAEFAQLPRSGSLVLAHYGFDDPSRRSGRLSVVSPAGQVRATYPYPRITAADGTPLAVHPREIDADPLGAAGDERFVVIFDAETTAAGAATGLSAFAIQEFRFDARAGTITPTSLPVLSGDRAGGQPLSFETARYAAGGDLWVGQALAGTLQGGPLAIFHRARASGSVLGDRRGCSAPAAWRGERWGSTCAPDERIAAASPLGIPRSLTEDAATGSMVLATLSGSLLAVRPVGGTRQHAAGTPVDLGLGQLVDRTVARIGPRKGAEDQATRTLWLPIQQLTTPATCAAWPCAPQRLAQWLYGIDVAALLDAG